MIYANLKYAFVNSCNLIGAALLLLSGCSPKTHTVSLEFELHAPPKHSVDLAFYISDVQVQDQNGRAYELSFEHNGQTSPLALVSLSTAKSHVQLEGKQYASPPLSGLAFTVGVPQPQNHANPLTAPYPLNDSGMFWSWQQGYKFLRIDGSAPTKWALHLGSTGCTSPSALRPPPVPCEHDNRLQVHLPDFVPGKHKVVVDVTALAEVVNHQPALNCTMNYSDQKACSTMLTKLGLNAKTGTCVQTCRHQTLFALRDSE